MRTYILLDASSSMGARWDEAKMSIDAYVGGLSDDEEIQSSHITVATFSSPGSYMEFNILRNGTVEGWEPLKSAKGAPYGMTPLYDAIGRIVGMAESDNPERAVIIIMTDGEENTSREIDKNRARIILDRARARGWQVIFMGADFDAMRQGGSLGANAGHTLNISTRNLQSMMAQTATYSSNYASKGTTMAFTQEDRESAEA